MSLQGARCALRCAVLLAFPTRALASDTPHEFEANADLHVGVATTLLYTAPFDAESPRAEGSGGALVFGGTWRSKQGFSVGLGVPLVLIRLTEPAGGDRDEPAWGNPFFSFETRMPFERSVEGFFRLGIGAPLADHGPPGTLSKSRALAVADAIRG